MTIRAGSPGTLHVIHHSHTDVGYTQPQHRIARWHADFIRRALEIVAASRHRRGPHFDGFRWVCETFWGVERFLERATASEREAFRAAVRSGEIGLSGTYLNLNELLEAGILSRMLGRAGAFGESIGVGVDSAMTADINGYSWGYAQALHDNGIRNLFTCIHTHHGMYPLGRTQVPFWWETPRGDRVLVWSGEHYHFGNELGIIPGAVSSYLTKDECDAEMIFHDHWSVAGIRIPRYLETLAARGYPFDFAPVMVSGLRTDNGPPSGSIVDLIERWNRERGDRIRIEMTTLDGFFARLRAADAESPGIPVHRGDWPDWWSDGMAGDPECTRIFREAQRGLTRYRALVGRWPAAAGEGGRIGQSVEERLARAEMDLTYYAEHTFSHADAMAVPWYPPVHTISARKRAFAISALETVEDLTDDALVSLGATTLRADMPLRYRIVNPFDRPVRGVGRFHVGHYEYCERRLDGEVEVRRADEGDGSGDVRPRALPSQRELVPGGCDFRAWIELEAAAACEIELRAVDPMTGVVSSTVDDVGDGAWRAPSDTVAVWLETPLVRITGRGPDGIVGWTDVTGGRELLRDDRLHPPFAPVHEITPVAGRNDICAVRGRMALNRKGENVIRSVGRCTGVRTLARGPVIAITELRYETSGIPECTIELRGYLDAPRVDVAVRMHKSSAWEPENVHLPLPFTAVGGSAGAATAATGTTMAARTVASAGPRGGQLWLDKTGAAVRPRVDQIPGTLTDFYSVQAGLALVGDGFGIAVATPDTNLVQVGPLEHGPRRLAGDPGLADDPEHLHAWVMTNYWETNFSAELGGFYEFRYVVVWGSELADPERALAACRDVEHDLIAFRLTPGPEDGGMR